MSHDTRTQHGTIAGRQTTSSRSYSGITPEHARLTAALLSPLESPSERAARRAAIRRPSGCDVCAGRDLGEMITMHGSLYICRHHDELKVTPAVR